MSLSTRACQASLIVLRNPLSRGVLLLIPLLASPSSLHAADYDWNTCSSLVAHYKLNDNAENTIVKDNAGPNSGTLINGGATSSMHVSGKLGSGAFHFDGIDDYVNCGNQVVNGVLSGDFAVCLWFRQGYGEEAPPEWPGAMLVSNHKPAATIYPGIRIVYRTNKKVLGRIFFADGTDWAGWGNKVISDADWHFVVLQRKGKTMEFYLDSATPDASSWDPKYEENVASTNPFAIGCYYVLWPTNFFQGDIDDARVYNRALTPQEIAALLNGGAGTEECSGVVIEPTPTPTPSPTPIDPCTSQTCADGYHLDFPDVASQWVFVAAPAFNAPAHSMEVDALRLAPAGSAGAFGFWSSPWLQVEGGETLEIAWTVRSSCPASQCPQFRLRVNESGLRYGSFETIESKGQGEMSPGPTGRNYVQYYTVPPFATDISLAFDLLSFDPADDLSASVDLTDVRITEIAPPSDL